MIKQKQQQQQRVKQKTQQKQQQQQSEKQKQQQKQQQQQQLQLQLQIQQQHQQQQQQRVKQKQQKQQQQREKKELDYEQQQIQQLNKVSPQMPIVKRFVNSTDKFMYNPKIKYKIKQDQITDTSDEHNNPVYLIDNKYKFYYGSLLNKVVIEYNDYAKVWPDIELNYFITKTDLYFGIIFSEKIDKLELYLRILSYKKKSTKYQIKIRHSEKLSFYVSLNTTINENNTWSTGTTLYYVYCKSITPILYQEQISIINDGMTQLLHS